MGDTFPPVTRREMIALAGASALAGCSIAATGTQQTRRDTTEPENQQAVESQQRETVRAFVGSYHWGYFVLDETGAELEQLTLSSGDELRLTLFNVEADAAIDSLPRRVRRNIPTSDERARRNEQAIPVPDGTTLDTLHDAAEVAYPDHSLVILSDEYMRSNPGGPGQGPGSSGPGGPGGGHHGPHGGPYGPGRGGRGSSQMPGTPYGPGMMPGYGPGMHGYGSEYGGTLAPPVYLWHHSTVPSELGFVVNTTGSFGFVCTVYCGYGHPYMAERSRVVVSEN